MRSNDGSTKELLLENQLCFPMYLAAKEIISKYTTLLEPLELTYTQYLVMMVLWQYPELDMKELGEKLFLDSSTLTPVVNRLVKKKFVSKMRANNDKRRLMVCLEEEGLKLKERAKEIPSKIYQSVNLTIEEALQLKSILAKVTLNLTNSTIAE